MNHKSQIDYLFSVYEVYYHIIIRCSNVVLADLLDSNIRDYVTSERLGDQPADQL